MAMFTLSQSVPAHNFPHPPRKALLSTSGNLSGASIKLSYRHLDTQSWVPYPDMPLASGQHFSEQIEWMGPKNRIEVVGASASTNITVWLSSSSATAARSSVIVETPYHFPPENPTPAPARVSGGTITGSTVPGNLLTAVPPVWSNAVSTGLEWWKNGIPTGNTGLTYSDTTDGDVVTARFRATNPTATIYYFSPSIQIQAVQASASRQLPVFVTADIDPANERDDEAAVAMLLATQDHFNITGLAGSSPDGVEEGFWQMLGPYGLDRPKLASHSPNPERFKSEQELRQITYNSTGVTTTPSTGYYTTQNDYYKIHAAAQALILAAQEHGNPASSDPYDKLWIWVLGGFNTLAQAMYEAVQLGQLPDFCKRVRILSQPNYNGYADQNAWYYIFNNCWPASGTPGVFGDLWMIGGYLQWHDLNDTGNPATAVWDELVQEGAMGAFMEAERIAGDHPGRYFRAGDAGAWLWTISAKIQNNFDPGNASNWAGSYKSYQGQLWAAQTFGYGTGSGQGTTTPSPQGTTWSTTLFAPNIPVGHCNLTIWYQLVLEAFDRYKSGRSGSNPATRLLEVEGSYERNWTLDPPLLPVVAGTAATWKLHHHGGSAISSPVTVVLSDATSVVVSSVSPNPIEVVRTVGSPGAYTLSISSLSDTGLKTPGVPVIVKSSSYYSLGQYLVAEYLIGEGSGQTIGDTSTNANHLTLGPTSGAEATDPAWVSEGIALTAGQFALCPVASASMNVGEMTLVALIKPSSISGIMQIGSRDSGSGTRHWQLFQDGSRIKISAFNATTTSTTQTGTGVLAAGQWALVTARIQPNGKIQIWVNGALQGRSYMLAGPMRSTSGSLLRLGARMNSSSAIVETFEGQIGYFAWYGATDIELRPAIENRARQIAQNKSITLP